ncbi:MAG TPA: hypothetical protein VMN39_07175 [Longimicrobiaceae bacterium]|nr:hypothetical protein [Longimicrobiaceae bacterium]
MRNRGTDRLGLPSVATRVRVIGTSSAVLAEYGHDEMEAEREASLPVLLRQFTPERAATAGRRIPLRTRG